MLNHTATHGRVKRVIAACSVAVVATLGMAACSSSGSSGSNDKVGVALIVKTTSNPYFVSMETAAKAAAATAGVNLTLAAGTKDGDTDTQITAIENSISRGDKGILITPNGPAVNNEIAKARKAGLYVIALDTPPDPANTVDITFATDNFAAGEAIGKWTAAKLDGKKAVIAMVDLSATQSISVDYDRDTGFLTGMGIKVPDKKKNGSEAPTGSYTGATGGNYEIVGHQPSGGAEDGGRTAMETLLSKNSNINVVYAINEPAAYGAYQALKAAGKTSGVLLVAIDGGCTGVGYVKDGILGATSQQYPSKMATLGMAAIVKLAKTGKKATTSTGLNFFNTGSQLITDQAVTGLPSIDTTAGSKICWKN
ncbi:MAG TPA: substrate-binding domain-containing protein [Microbacteriaceae bacterium]